ncbi:MAG: VCBS repeat-containing protein [Deltaproteobacteria bacterium]|nr:VCBS repeat-containing protein [Deltaproteobacteria bacterium]
MKKEKAADLLTKGVLLVTFFLLLGSVQTETTFGDSPVKVAVLPFTMVGEAGDAYLKEGIRAVLSARVASGGEACLVGQSEIAAALKVADGALTEEKLRSVARQLDTDFIVTGVVKKRGTGTDIDVDLISFLDREVRVPFSIQGLETNDVISRVSRLAEDLRIKMLALSRDDGAPSEGVGRGEALREERILSGEPARKGSAGRVGFVEAPVLPSTGSAHPDAERVIEEPGMVSSVFWKSEKIPEEIRGLAVGDVDGDNRQEVAVITDDTVVIYVKNDGDLTRLYEYQGERASGFLRVEVADVNQNGKDEIFVSAVRGNSVSSIVLEQNGEGLEKIAGNLQWFFWVGRVPGEGLVLLGQVYGSNGPFQGDVHRLVWDSGAYSVSEGWELPAGLNVFGLGIMGSETSDERLFVTMENSGRLVRYDNQGAALWASEDRYKGTEVELTIRAGHSDDETAVIPLRLVTKDLNADGKMDIIVAENFSEGWSVLGRGRCDGSGVIDDLQWDGEEMGVRWKTQTIDGCIADYGIADADNDGEDELVVGINARQTYLTFRPKSYILIYELSGAV